MQNNDNQLQAIIFVNSTAATSGGALTVLHQFLKSIPKYDIENVYYIFCTAPEVNQYESDNVKIINNIYKKKWIGRVWWDNFGMGRWAKQNGIRPDLIVSLQNTGVRLGKIVKQIVYYHQSLPMYEYNWSLWKKKERLLWFYKNIYPWFVKRHFYQNDILVVQSDWMKEASNKVLKIDTENIIVIKSTMQIHPPVELKEGSKPQNEHFNIIYPATDLVFKNHKVIYDALKQVSNERQEILKNIKLYTTLVYNKELSDEIKGLEKNIEFLGNIEYSELMEKYTKMDLMVFPSYLETVGLPLLEAAYFGLPIITSDLPYAKEAISGYNGVRFVEYNDPNAWANEIIDVYQNRNKYLQFKVNNGDTWSDMFRLIRQHIK